MLTFRVLIDGKSPSEFNPDPMYLSSLEGQPIRARFRYNPEHGLLFCDRRSQGLAALNLPWSVRGGSRLMLRTALLPDREDPYLLPLELARGQFSEMWRKRDDWGYIYKDPAHGFRETFNNVRLLLARAMTVQDAPLVAADLAEDVLARTVNLGESLARADAHMGLVRRGRREDIPQADFGCHWELATEDSTVQERFAGAFQMASVPFVWRRIEPREQELAWKWHDDWIHWLEAKGMGIRATGLVRFDEASLPDWVWIWENDFETIRDYVFDHVERCVQRYRGRVDVWDAITGAHVDNCLGFSLDQLLEVSRIATRAVKRTDPQAQVALDLVQPWGEYFAANQQSIWPFHYAEMCVNAGIDFDVIGVPFLFGTRGQGFHCRDLLAVSDMLDRFAMLGKPLHVTAGVPSACYPDPQARAGGKDHEPGAGGIWHKSWDEVVQSDWLGEFYRIAISKPAVRAVCWRDYSDHQPHMLPHAGLLRKNLEPKIAYQHLVNLRHDVWPGPEEEDIGYPVR